MSGPPTSDKILPADQLEVYDHVEKSDNVISLEGAILAEEAEQAMGFKEAFRDYRSAVLWSFGISLCIIMEGYDTALPVS